VEIETVLFEANEIVAVFFFHLTTKFSLQLNNRTIRWNVSN